MKYEAFRDSDLEGKINAFLGSDVLYIFLHYIDNSAYFAYLSQIIENTQDQPQRIVFIDLNWRFFDPKVNNREWKRSVSLRESFFRELSDRYPHKFTRILMSEKQTKNRIKNFDAAFAFSTQLGNSVLSLLISRGFSHDNLYLDSLRKRYLFRKYTKSFFQTLDNISPLLETYEIKKVVFLNGRWPQEAAIRHFCESNRIEFMSLEHGKPKNQRFHLERFQTQEYQYLREYFLDTRDKLKPEEIQTAEKWAEAWLEAQAKTTGGNQFFRGGDPLPDECHTENFVLLLNSSFDERFSNLGMEMNGWNSQEEAFASVIERLRFLDFKLVFRIHPNTANKSWFELLRLVKLLKDLQVKYIFPWTEISTYDLMDKANFIVSWGSTSSLEATARGIPAVNLGRTQYDNLVDITLWSPKDLSNLPIPKNQPSHSKSKVAIYLTRNWGYVAATENDRKSNQSSALNQSNYIKFLKAFYRLARDGKSSRPDDSILLMSKIFGKKRGTRLIELVLDLI